MALRNHARTAWLLIGAYCATHFIQGVSSVGDFNTAFAISKECSSALLTSRHFIRKKEAPISYIDCLLECAGEEDLQCIQAAVTGDFGKDAECILLAFHKEDNYTLSETKDCLLMDVDQCENNGRLQGGVCDCLPGHTGMYCDEYTTEGCESAYHIIHSVVGDDTQPSTYNIDGTWLFGTITGKNAKVAITRQGENHVSIGQVTFQNLAQDDQVQVHDTLQITQEGDFKRNALIETYVITSGGMISVLEINANGSYKIDATFGQVDIYTRDNAVVDYPRDSQYLVADLYDALDNGSPASSQNTVIMAGSDMYQKGGRYTLVTSTGGFISNPPHFLVTNGWSGSNESPWYSRYFDLTTATGSSNDPPGWTFDPCWYQAGWDVKKGETFSADHARNALRSGRPARVRYNNLHNDIFGEVKAVFIYNDCLLFMMSPFLGPSYLNELDSYALMLHAAVSSQGQITSCLHRMLDLRSEFWDQYQVPVHFLNIWVSSGTWQKVLETSTKGDHFEGSEAELRSLALGGADVHVTIDFLSGLFISFMADWLHIGSDFVAAQSALMLSLVFNDTGVVITDSANCRLKKYLANSRLGASEYYFTYGTDHEARYGNLTTQPGKVTWYARR